MLSGHSIAHTIDFNLEEVRPGVYAAIATLDGGAVGNAGFVDLGDKTLVFDTTLSPTAAADLRKLAEQLTGRPVTYIVNSHFHNDHIRGNQAFDPNTPIISTHTTRLLLQTRGLRDLATDRNITPEQLSSIQDQYKAAVDEKDRRFYKMLLGYLSACRDSGASSRLHFPEIDFETKLGFYGAQRSAFVLSLGPGHTASDAFLYLPEEKIIFMGDLLFNNFHPLMIDGDALAWIDVLTQIEALGMETFIPGHGPVGTVADLLRLRHYIAEVDEMAGEIISKGGKAENAQDYAIPAAYEFWEFPHFFYTNIKHLINIKTT